jgi:hypothetical protein
MVAPGVIVLSFVSNATDVTEPGIGADVDCRY